MAAKKLTPAFYKALCDAYRRFPDNHVQAAKAVGCSLPTARKGWHKGWRWEWARPIKQVIKGEQLMARAARLGKVSEVGDVASSMEAAAMLEKERQQLEELAQAAEGELAKAKALREEAEVKNDELAKRLADIQVREAEIIAKAERQAVDRVARAEDDAKRKMAEVLERAHLDAAEVLAEEAQGTKIGRRLAIQGLQMALRSMAHAKRVSELLDKSMSRVNEDELQPGTVFGYAERLTRLNEAVHRTWQMAMEEERLRLNQPTEIVEVRDESVSIEETERMARALAALAERRKLKALPGGGETTEPKSVEVTVVSNGDGTRPTGAQ